MTETARLIAVDGAASSSFGGSVSISGSNLAVGATEVVDSTQGAAYVLATVRATTITSSAIKSATIGRKYAYQVKTNAGTPQTMTFSLGAAPAGMSINASTGLVNWVPNVFQTGSSTVTVLATDQFGDTAQQTFNISVSGVATPYNPFAPTNRGLVIVGPIRGGSIVSATGGLAPVTVEEW